MNFDHINRWLTLLANLGVVTGIVFLGVELRQNNELLSIQAQSDREAVRRTAFTRYIENPELVHVIVKAQTGEPLSAEEAFLLNRAHQWTLWDWSNIYRGVQQGFLDDGALSLGWRSAFRQGGAAMQATWNSEKLALPDDFVRWMEANIVNQR